MARILVIDDEPVILKVLEEVLQDAGHEIISAGSGMEGVEILRQGVIPEGILIDLFMPGLSGREFVIMVRQEFKMETVPIILMTGAVNSTLDFPPKGTYQDVISKPFDIMELVAKVNQLVSEPTDSN
ncbi:MAG: response regulator [Firmicutes bacterium]|nr:response regulator [Bacillota bacterium]